MLSSRVLCFVVAVLCSVSSEARHRSSCRRTASVKVVEDDFGQIDSTVVKRYTFTNANNMVVQIITYGGRISVLKVPDAEGNVDDVMLGYDNLEGYRSPSDPYFAAILGRVANRIGGAKFTLNGVEYHVSANDGQNQLHGGIKGFDKVVWVPYLNETKLTLSYVSTDGEEGFPGAVLTQVTYELTDDSELYFEVKATSTKPTPINIANHAYFNLAGQATGPDGLFQHYMYINADQYTVTNSENIPTGELASVVGTELDFLTSKQVGPLIQKRGGYDNNFCINPGLGSGPYYAAKAVHPPTGRFLEIYTDQPGVQFYTGNGLPQPGSATPLIGKGGVQYHQYGSFSLETQDYPDAVNHPNFPSSILNPGETYSHTTIYKFGVTNAGRKVAHGRGK